MEITRRSAAPGAGQADSQAAAGAPPRLAPGVELIGEYEDSGFKEAPYLARRADGQVLQMSKLLYAVAEAIDGRRDYDAIAEVASGSFGKRMNGEQARQLVEQRLRRLGVVAGADGQAVGAKRLDPMLALKFRAGLVPEGAVAVLTAIFKPLFWPPVVVGALLALGAVDAYVFFLHGVAQGVRDLLYSPTLMLLVLGLIILSAGFHEIGHATACAYGGAKPGKLGAGIYIVWPAFYSDVTDAYRLGKGGRLRTDLGGVYFNCIFMLATAAAYFATHYEPLLVVIAVQHVEIIHQFLPFLRLDGYYVIADLTGVPDIFGRVKPVLRSLLPGRSDPKVDELKGWVRVAVTIWVVTMIPVVLLLYGMLILNAPRVFATAWDSVHRQYDGALTAWQHGGFVLAFVDSLQALLLVLPAIGLLYSGISMARRIAQGTWRRTEGRPALRAGAVVVGAAALVLIGWTWLPRQSNYRPIAPTETGTVPSAVVGVVQAPGVLAGAQPAAAPAGVEPSAAPSAAPTSGTTSGTGGTTTTTNPTTTTTTNPSPAATPAPSSTP